MFYLAILFNIFLNIAQSKIIKTYQYHRVLTTPKIQKMYVQNHQEYVNIKQEFT